MSTRKVTIKVAGKEELLDLLENLETIGEINIEATVEDSKQTYSQLVHALDWDFAAEKKGAAKETVTGILKDVTPRDWNGLGWMIEAVWKAAQKSPAVLFQSDFFWTILKEVYSQTPSPEHAILTKLGEARYSEWEWKEIDEDITQILNNEWKQGLGKKSLVELSRIIYGR